MHAISIEPDAAITRDCWSLSADELERLAVSLLGAKPGGWVRQSGATTLIANRHRAAEAKTLPAELAALGERAKQILAGGGPGAGLRAAAFFHLRFENLHPLHDGNGRVGRLLLAMQCEQAARVPARETLDALHGFENEYKWVFVPDEQAQRFELLLDLLARITGAALPENASALPFPLETPPPVGKPPTPAVQRGPARAAPQRRSSFF